MNLVFGDLNEEAQERIAKAMGLNKLEEKRTSLDALQTAFYYETRGVQ